MKFNVQKLQAGGYITYQPLPMIPEAQAPQQAPADAQEKKDDSPYLDKTILNKMLGQGITTDVMAYSEGLQQAYESYSKMDEFQRNSYKGKQLRNTLKGDLGQLNALMRGKKMLDESINNAKGNGALEEFAVTSNGMVVLDNNTGKITTVSFQEFATDNNTKDKKYSALTNAQLAEQREYNKQLIGNSGVYSILNYGKGVEKVKDEVMKIITTIGSSKNSVTNGAFQRGDEQDIAELVAAAKQGTFKVKSGESSETNRPQIERAKMTMWMNLSDNSKNVLRARAATSTTNPADIEKTAMTMAASLLDPHESTSVNKVYDESLRGPGAGGAGGSDKKTNMGPIEMAFQGKNDGTPISQIGSFGVKIDGMAYALPPSVYTDKNNMRTPLTNAGGLNQISYLSKAFTANGDPVNAKNAMIVGDAYFAWLPVISDDNGNMKIDEAGAKKWAEYEDALSKVPQSQRTPLKESELKNRYGVTQMNVKKMVVAEAASYDNQYRIFSNRDDKYYGKLDKATKELLEQTVDPDSKGARNWVDYSAHKHLVFIPAKEEASARFADGHFARIDGNVYDVAKGYNSVNTTSRNYGEQDSNVQKMFSADVWNNQ